MFSVHSLFREMTQFDEYFPDGLVQPPTRGLLKILPRKKSRFFCGFFVVSDRLTWRIIPISKWLIIIVNKSPK